MENIQSGDSNINNTNGQCTVQDILPNQTLYVNNLNEKVKLDELKQNLFHLFSQFGDIIEINARKSFKMKGQAFILFRDLNSATNAKVALNGSLVFGKPIGVTFSKTQSDTILKLTGSLSQKDKTKRDLERKKRREEEYQEIKKKANAIKAKEGKDTRKPHVEKNENKQVAQQLPANNILFVENLSADVTEPLLRNVFSKYNGFKEVRFFPGKGVAFVEYDHEINAGGALLGLNNLLLTNDCVLRISFAKK